MATQSITLRLRSRVFQPEMATVRIDLESRRNGVTVLLISGHLVKLPARNKG